MTELHPRVSVVIPTRNNLDVLPKALRSVADQRFPELEVIVADDGSTDGTSEFLADLMEQDGSLRVVETGGCGPAAARNRAVSLARAPLVAFLDSDDWWNPGKLKRQVAFLERHPSIGFSFTDYLALDPEGRSHGTCFEYWKPPHGARPPHGYEVIPDPVAELLGRNTAGTSTIVVRRSFFEAIGGFSTDLPSAEDWDCWLRLAETTPVAATSIVTTCYLMRPNSETTRRQARLDAMATIIARYADRPEPTVRAAARRARALMAAGRADVARLDSRHFRAAAQELRAFSSAPSLRGARTAAADVLKGFRRGFGASPAALGPAVQAPRKDGAPA